MKERKNKKNKDKKKKFGKATSSNIKVDKKKQEEQKRLLKKIYSVKLNNDVNSGDLKKIYYKKHSVWKKVILYFLFFIFLIASSSLAGYYYFYKDFRFDGSKVYLTVSSPVSSKVASLNKFIITVNNLEKVKLENVKVILQAPENFILVNSSIPLVKESKNTWLIPEIEANSISKIEIEAYFDRILSDSNNEYEKLNVDLYYNAENFSSLFKEHTEKQLLLNSVKVDLSLSEKIDNTGNRKYIIHYKNLEDEDLHNLILKANIPNAMQIKDLSRNIDNEVDYDEFKEVFWNLDELKAGAEGEVSFSIDLQKSLKDDLYAEIFVKSKDGKDIIASKNLQLNLQAYDLTLDLAVNDDNRKQCLADNFQVNYTITYANNTDHDLNDVNIDFYIDDFVSKDPLQHIFNWNTVKDEYDGTIARTEKGAKINWDYHNIKSLKNLKAGESGQISFTIDRYNQKLSAFSWRDFDIQNYIMMSYDENGEKNVFKSNVININFQKNLDLSLIDSGKLGEGEDSNNLYKLIFQAKTDKNIDYLISRFILNDKVELENIDNEEDKDYKCFIEADTGDLLVKFDDLKNKENKDNLVFKLLLKTSKDCKADDLSCFFKEIKAKAISYSANEIYSYYK